MTYDKQKFWALVSDTPSTLLEDIQWRKENRGWLRNSAKIAMRILRALRKENISQRELADRLGVSPQQVSKIVKGKENFTLETIAKIEKALGISLIEVAKEAEPPVVFATANFTEHASNLVRRTLPEKNKNSAVTFSASSSTSANDFHQAA